MPVVPQELFLEAIDKVVRANSRFVPPYGTGASLYIRPLVIGVGPRVGLGPAEEYIFLVLVTPVGPYYKGGFKPVKALVLDKFDRAAPDGVGDCKVGGNYAAGLPGGQYGYQQGYPIVLYLDSKEKKYVDEFGTSNFIGIKDGVYLTPSSKSILPSITNLSLMKLAEKIGMKVEKRPIAIDEVKNFQELGAVGTAAVITPVQSITWQNETYMIGQEGIAGPMMTRLYEEYTGIQTGDKPDDYGWLREIL